MTRTFYAIQNYVPCRSKVSSLYRYAKEEANGTGKHILANK